MSSKFQRLVQPSIVATAVAFLAVINFPLPLAAAPASFNQAVADYNAGKYGIALTELQAYASAYPNNALVRYYIALCQQGMGHFDKAKSEFQWVSQNGDARLSSMASAGMQQLSNAHTQIASSSISSATTAGHSQAGGQAADKVKKVLEFYTDW